MRALVVISSTLSHKQLRALLKDCRLIENFYERGDTLAKLFCSLPLPLQPDVVLDWLEIVEELAPEYTRRHWRTICAVLSPASVIKLRRAFTHINDSDLCAAPYAKLLVDLRTHLQPTDAGAVLEAADGLPAILAQLAHAVLEGANSSPDLNRCLEIRQVLFTVAPYLTPQVRRNAVDSFVRLMERASYAPSAWMELYARLGPVDPDLMAKGFQHVKTFEPHERLAFISTVAPFILAQDLPGVVELVQGLPESYQLDAYLELATASETGRTLFAGEVNRLYSGRTSMFSNYKRLLQARAVLPSARWNVLAEEEFEQAIREPSSPTAVDTLLALMPHVSEEAATRARTVLMGFIIRAVRVPRHSRRLGEELDLVHAAELLAGMLPLCDSSTRATLVRQAEQLASELSFQSIEPTSHPLDRARALVYLANCIDTEPSRSELSRLALRLTEHRPYGWAESREHATAVETIVRCVSSKTLLEFVRIGLRSSHIELRLGIIDAVKSRLLREPAHEIKTIWCQLLILVGGSPRVDLLSYLVALSPVLAHIYGMTLLEDCFDAFVKVVRWWP